MTRLILAIFLLAASVPAWAAGRCDGCGMHLAPYAETLHRLTLAGGKVQEYCSFDCLAEALGRLPGGQATKIEAADYTTGKLVDARTAAYVAGSDVPAVMGNVSLLAFAAPASADEFRKKHGGTRMGFDAALALQRGAAPAAAATPDHVVNGPSYVSLPKPGKQIPLEAGRSFVFSFDKKPSMGTVILKVTLAAAEDRQDAALEILGNADMPSMGCQRGKPDRPFVRNRKGDYLLPFTFGMPGGWEVYLTFRREGRVVFRGKYAFEI